MDKLKEFLKVAALLVGCFSVPWIAWDLMRITPGQIIDSPKPSYAELVLIVLAAVTVVLAVLAIIIAILAVWGYENIKKEASVAADRAVKATVEATVKRHANDERIKALLRKELKQLLGITLEESIGYTDAFPATETGGQQEAVGTEYPKGDAHDGQAD